MKKLILLRGVNGCGKTHLINQLNLQNITINFENFKCLINGFDMSENSYNISNKDYGTVLNEMMFILEKRMENGLLTIIDSNHIFERQIEKYHNLCNKYGYECIVVDFNVCLQILLERNKEKKSILNEFDIKKMYKDKSLQKIPSFCKKIKPEYLKNEIQLKFIDISKYKKVIHIGDIHGCASALKLAFNSTSFDNFYIFCGDYIDRGIQNVETLKYLLTLKSRPNVVFLKGNHEINLIKYVNNEETFGKTFEKTKNEIEDSDISLKELKSFCRQLKSIFTYSYNGKKVICTHGGISHSNNLNIISENNFILGTGDINENIDLIWDNNLKNNENIYQVHGHRNFYQRPISLTGSFSFNLEGGVESGGCLRMLVLTDKGFSGREIKNEVFSQ